MRLVIPMCGYGQRFVDRGYTTPKALLPGRNDPLLANVLHNLNADIFDVVDIIVRKDFANQHAKELADALAAFNVQIHKVEPTRGQADTIMSVKNELLRTPEDNVLIANCDQLITDENYIIDGLGKFIRESADGGIFCFLHDNPKWSFVRIKGMEIVETAEKKVIGDLATCGLYYFNRCDELIHYLEEMYRDNLTVNGEYYLCPVYNYMIRDGKKILPYLINGTIGVGTPEDYEAYMRREWL